MKKRSPADFVAELLSFAVPLGLYLSLPSTMWNFDGVACAMALELGDPVYFFHGNHLLYGALGYVFWLLLLPAGMLRALPALQLMTTLLSAIGLWGVYRTVKLVTRDSWISLRVVWALSVFAVLWVWSIEAQVYTLGFAALAWGTYVLMKPPFPSQGKWLGLLHGLAILGHVVNVLWLVPVLAGIFQMDSSVAHKKKLLRDYLVCAALCVLIPYAWVLYSVILPRHSDWPWIRQWLFGSAALTEDKSFRWHAPGLMGPWIWLKTSLRVVWGTFWPHGAAAPVPVLWALTAVSGGCLAVLVFSAWKARRQAAFRIAAVWIAVYAAFFSTWEPGTECYRVFDFVPLALFFAVAFIGLKDRKVFGGVMAGLIGCLFIVNLETRALPMSKLSENPDYQEMLSLDRDTAAGSVYLSTGGKRWIYQLYFAGRMGFNVGPLKAHPERLARLLDDRMKRGAVYIHDNVRSLDVALPYSLADHSLPLEGCAGWYLLLPLDAPRPAA